MARKPGTPPPRNTRITILVNKHEAREIQKIADDRGVSRSDVIRGSILRGQAPPPEQKRGE